MNPTVSKLPRQGELWQDNLGRFHRVVTLATVHAGLSPLVVYRPTHPQTSGTWACPLDEFLGSRNDGSRNFVRVTDDNEQDLWDALADVLPEHVTRCALDCYDQPWRTYHGRAHVVGIFSFARRHRFTLSPAQAVALLFHDAVYLPGAEEGANERASAVLLRLTCGGLDDTVLADAQTMVLDTIAHQPTLPESRLVQDLDLSVFVSAAQGLLDPSLEVWAEYRPLLAHDDPAAASVFWAARVTVLAGLLAKAPLYCSAEFAANPALEAHARAHLHAELVRAGIGQPPTAACK